MLDIILPLIFIVPGFLVVFAARTLVKKFNLNEKTKCEFESEMSEEELADYKVNKAVVNVKMMGMLIAIPGFVLFVLLK